MVRVTTPMSHEAGSPKQLAVTLLDSVANLWVQCARRASRASKKLVASNSRIGSKSPLTRPKQLLATISSKAANRRHKKKGGEEFDAQREEGEGGFGDGGLWQRSIMMGDKCQPLNFSGVIYYDSDGKRLSEFPTRSPRASPLPSYAYKSSSAAWE
ncbi:hypothetical protein RJ640_001008 [Escallonia rubra]|uniref:Uncharacterized protein n=1 Tax=Escallonia rubra TaxID=112253 RepID=A0AA88QZX1_9ASTE|nr:hypothetical protein RJ640_020413 [Escallonia rubra]KAK2985286.1 hypothetical protein RJ640_020412 [Escallonia rubra]KAK2992938.1 hypothetical protein RJ640_001008 [Escallonia rubra]